MIEAVLVLLLLSFLAILGHEAGHYLTYRRYGLPVLGFYIGGPPWVLRWRRGETEYRLGLLPLFGAVSVRWEDLDKLPSGKVLGVFLAGPAFNLLAGLSGFALLGAMEGKLPELVKVFGVLLALPAMLLQDLFRALLFDLPTVGAVPLVQTTGQVLGTLGLKGVLLMWGVINTVLFWFNLLPFPPLDGGQALFLLFRRRAWFDRVYPYVLAFGLAVLFALFEVTVLKDLARLFGGGR